MRKPGRYGTTSGRVLGANIAALLAVVGLLIAAPTSASAATGPWAGYNVHGEHRKRIQQPSVGTRTPLDDTIIAGGQFTEFDAKHCELPCGVESGRYLRCGSPRISAPVLMV